MAETTTTIGAISAQLTKASRLVVNTDSFWVQTGGDSDGNAQSALIPAEFVRAYLSQGLTPQFRVSGGLLQISYDNGSTWADTSVPSVRMVTLTQDAYDALVAAGTVDADTYYNILEE